MEANQVNNCTIVVNSCDAYKDTWELFFKAFSEHWNNCVYQIVLNTESEKCNIAGVTTHTIEDPTYPDRWGKRLRDTLNDIKTEYVIMLYDDFILEEKVDQEKIKQCIRWLDENKKINVFYFINIPNNGKNNKDYEGFERLPRTAEYKLNSAPAVWRREKLLKYTGDDDTPWAWEVFGSYKTFISNEQFYCSRKDCENIYPYNYQMGGAIYRGKWVGKVVLPLIKKYNLDLDVNKRGMTDSVGGENRRSLMWKIRFLLQGFKMIGFGMLLFIYRVFKKKMGLT